MSILHEERTSDSPYIEMVTCGRTVSDGSITRPAEIHWHMIVRKQQGRAHMLVVGPWTSAGAISYMEGAELLWIKLKLGAFLPHLPTRKFLDMETVLPRASSNSFWLKSAAWQVPDPDNVETFVEKLAREEILVRDPLVDAALQDKLPAIAPRTLRHRFLRATGQTQKHVRQFQRAQQAAALLRQGVSILDTVHEAGYFDQPHLTRSLKQFIGFTPAQLLRASQAG